MKKYFIIALLLLTKNSFGNKHFILISAPGSGKGTFSQYLIKKYEYEQICPGDIFRNEILLQTDLGKQIQPIVDKGEYIDEIIVCQLIEKHISDALQKNKYFILDGFPRSIISFNFLHSLLKKYKIENDVCVLQFIANDILCTKRIINRSICTHCFMVYSQIPDDTTSVNNCDHCHLSLTKRKADTQEIAEKRLQYFHENIEPLLTLAKKYYPIQKIETDCSLNALKEKYEKLLTK